MINYRFDLGNSFQEILYRIHNWINEWSGWIVALIDSQYINVLTYVQLSGSSYTKLPADLRSSKNGLINIKNNDQKCFHVVMLGILISWKYIHKELHRNIKSLLIIFIVIELRFLFDVFCYENKLTFPIYISSQKFENLMDLLLRIDGDKSHYVYIRDFNRFMFHKTKNKNKKILFQMLFIVFY